MRSPVKGLLLLSLAFATIGLSGCDTKPEGPEASDPVVVNKDLEDLLDSQTEVSIFAGLLDDAELDEVFDGPAPYTIIAPVNAAFEALPKEELTQLTEGEERAAKASSFAVMHILPGYVSMEDIRAALEKDEGKPVKMKTMAGPLISFNAAGDDMTVTFDGGKPVKLLSGEGSETGGILIVDGLLQQLTKNPEQGATGSETPQ